MPNYESTGGLQITEFSNNEYHPQIIAAVGCRFVKRVEIVENVMKKGGQKQGKIINYFGRKAIGSRIKRLDLGSKRGIKVKAF